MREEILAYKRERIIEEAVKLFYARGFTGTTLDDIAAELGVTKPFIYTHFRSKVELLAALCTPTIEMSLAAVENAAKLSGRPTERLHRAIVDFTHVILSRQANIAIFFREEKNLTTEALAEINALRRQFDRVLSQLLAEGNEAGEFHIADVNSRGAGDRRHDQLGLHVASSQWPAETGRDVHVHGGPRTADGGRGENIRGGIRRRPTITALRRPGGNGVISMSPAGNGKLAGPVGFRRPAFAVRP